MINPSNPKERNLVKGSIMRVFSRSELRREVLSTSIMPGYTDPNRPRVTKWSMCRMCNTPTPTYLMEVDHIIPKIPMDRSLEEMTWDELIDRTWCNISNLQPICRTCHSIKSRAENKIRKELKNVKGSKSSKRSTKTISKRSTTRSTKSRTISRSRK